jgi:asparagine synthetase A
MAAKIFSADESDHSGVANSPNKEDRTDKEFTHDQINQNIPHRTGPGTGQNRILLELQQWS